MSLPHFTTWLAFIKGRRLAASVYRMSATFPREEKYSLTDQIRRSSRSVCANLAESFAKRRYPKHFIAKLTDAAGENYETMAWLAFALDHGYIRQADFEQYVTACSEVGKLLSYMQNHPDKFR
ncbi:four helix bundle protein [Neolewinella xylanilytica]|uniref:Four helix bundle protein n=1 Tax=Neolewinella xylanilytica TaxID=1514080 RepID=A0A2S6I237_9BACT|nr:four helix bundle protein [Neolewinella xylanilytica]PPK85210.1 four helix bundle protein [Neolewinella xylanilytica]